MSALEDCCATCPNCLRVLYCDTESLCRHIEPVGADCCCESLHVEEPPC